MVGRALAANTALLAIDLEDNEIGNAGLMALAKAMTTMDAPTLVNINVDDVHVQQSGLTVEDAKILRGALTFRDMPVSAVMTPLDRCFSLDASASLVTGPVAIRVQTCQRCCHLSELVGGLPKFRR